MLDRGFTITGSGASAQINVSGVAGSSSVLDTTTSVAQQAYTVSVPANTPLSSISVEVIATPSLAGGIRSTVNIQIFEIYVQA